MRYLGQDVLPVPFTFERGVAEEHRDHAGIQLPLAEVRHAPHNSPFGVGGSPVVRFLGRGDRLAEQRRARVERSRR
jgi:hypothetical protein